MPKIDLPDDELQAAIAALRQTIEGERYPHAPRLDPLRAALARMEAAKVAKDSLSANGQSAESPAGKGEKRPRR